MTRFAKPLLSKLYQCARDLLEAGTDRRLGIDTTAARVSRAYDPAARNAFYEPTSYAALRGISRRVPTTTDDVICDLGCGKGRVLCWFAALPVARCVGIEFDSLLADAARQNAARMRRRLAPIDVLTQDATLTDFTGVSIVTLFNPFGQQVLRPVLTALSQSLRDDPRALTLIYINPVHRRVFDDFPHFVQTDRFNYLYGLLPTADVLIFRVLGKVAGERSHPHDV